ncbi:MAG: hypothetical protein MRJ65_11105 [Candidatus Brocadiaceae bacterium]|nr:hypothetical protein [Candidatus Brocadiaceae bacterium]
MLEYQLGEMRGKDGSALRYEVEVRTMEFAISISRKIELTTIYKQLIEKLPSKRVLLYFQYVIKKEIYPFIRQGCVIQWHERNGKAIPIRERTVRVPKTGIFILLKECWDFENIPILLVNPLVFSIKSNILLKALIKSYVKKTVVRVCKSFNWYTKKGHYSSRYGECGIIACHYTEGINPSRRNDLNWYIGSNIAPERVLIYIDNNNVDNSRGKKVGVETVLQIEKQGFKCVTLKKGVVDRGDANYWQPSKMPSDLFIGKKEAQNKVEGGIIGIANNLLEETYYWRCFYDDFYVRINYTAEEGIAKNIAQAIAFDIEKGKPGFLVGKQRSEIFLPHSLYCIGYHPKHIFFIWNKREEKYFRPNYNQNDLFVVAGYANDLYRKKADESNKSVCQQLRLKGVQFIVVLFDNMYGSDIHFSRKAMIDFYQPFLEWMLNDTTIGIVIKSKKPFVINNIQEIHPLLNKALESGRCIKISNEFGFFPSEASFGADMAIGCGVSSAVIEAVIGGCKGIHYDMTHLKNHEFYKWGYEKIVFDDLDRMMVSLKKYKENPQNNRELGDWSSYLNELDPFRDGKGGERMGAYMQWLLEAFDKGNGRDEAIQYANKLYSEQWGSDKIIPMCGLTECC